jgi:hypothetical protein
MFNFFFRFCLVRFIPLLGYGKESSSGFMEVSVEIRFVWKSYKRENGCMGI